MESELHQAVVSLLPETFNVHVVPVEMLVEALKQTSWEATILLYSPALGPHLQKMTEPADGMCSDSTKCQK